MRDPVHRSIEITRHSHKRAEEDVDKALASAAQTARMPWCSRAADIRGESDAAAARHRQAMLKAGVTPDD
jgi:flavin-binding protein dodecin